MENLISSNRINVTVGYQTFSIPADKANQVVNLLSTLQSIQVNEQNPSPILKYNGQSLING
jgi:hypothetical protein